MRRISSFDEMPYDDSLLGELRSIDAKLEAGPRRSAFRILMQFVQMDMNRGGVVRRPVIEAVLRELGALTGELEPHPLDPANLRTLSGYAPSIEDILYHGRHDPYEDRWDDCPLCWADVLSDDQRNWLLELGMDGPGNSMAVTAGMRPRMKGDGDE